MGTLTTALRPEGFSQQTSYLSLVQQPAGGILSTGYLAGSPVRIFTPCR